MNLDAQEAASGLLGLSPTNLTPTVATAIIHSPTSTIPSKRKHRDETDLAGEAIDCICGFEVDDGFSIACDVCSRWCHFACFDVAPEEIPDQFKCWTCKPRPASFKERAVRMQKERLELGGVEIVEKQRRKASPGVERKHRRVSFDRRKRRPSIVNEDEHVDIDEPWSQSYIHISQDHISDDDTRVKLRQQAQHWRGVTAVADSSSLVKELPPADISFYSNPDILPPAFSLHTTAPITTNRLITGYKSSITPSASYLADPLNAYAHLGMPKPFVHLFGPPLDVALDSRLVGNHGRFARSGCRPNAVLRPLLCDDSDNLGFGVFALRDLQANEEVVLGWEWDDGNAVHNLPALLKTPHIFPLQTCRARQVQHLRHQMSNILHALSSTFTTCACGARAQDCAINRMAAFVDGVPTENGRQDQHVDLGPLVGRKRGFKTRERIPFSGGMAGMVMCRDNETSPRQRLPVSPSSPILNERSIKGKERAIDGDIERADTCDKSACEAKNNQDSTSIPRKSLRPSPYSPKRLKSPPTFDLRPPDPGGPYQHVNYDPPDNEDSMPPKMRKRWMHRELESLRELNGNTSPSSSHDSNFNHIVRLSESPGSSSTSGVSLGSPTIAPSKLTMESGLGITSFDGYGHDRAQCENNHQENHERHQKMDVVLTSEHHHHPASMPPPPMPAFLDPTTISSTKSSTNTNQHIQSSSTTLIPPSISPLTSFANLSLLSPALLRSTPPPSPLVPITSPTPNPGMTTATPTASSPRDNNDAAWSPLRRHTAASSSTSPLSVSVSLSSYPNDNDCIVPPPSLTTIPINDAVGQPVESPSCTPSPPSSPSSLQADTLFVDTNNEIQSSPHSPDPTWRADSPSGDHVNSLDTPVHISNHDGIFESEPEVSLTGLEEVPQRASMNEDGDRESPVLEVNGDHTNVGISSSRSPSPNTHKVLDHLGRDEQKNLHPDNPKYMSASNQSPILNDVPSSKPIPFPLPQQFLPDFPSLPTSQHDSTAQSQSTLEEKESEPQEQRQPSQPPAPKVKMSLRDFALRKKKQREEEEMTKSVQDTPSSGGVNVAFIGNEGGGNLNGIEVNRVGRGDGELSDGKMVVDGINGVGVKAVELKEDLVDDLSKDSLYQGASTLSRNIVKDEVVDVAGTASKPTATNGYYHPSPAPVPTLLAARIQGGTSSTFTYPIPTRQSNQELIEQSIPTATTRPVIMDNTRYAAMYNNSGSISPINPDPHHFESYSPPRPCQEDGEIGEIMDTPLRLPSSFSPAAPPAINRSALLASTIPSSSSIPPLPRGSIAKRVDFSFTRSVSSSSQIRHSPPTHPRSFNASPPYRQQPPSAPTPPPARGTGVPPPTAPRALRQYMSSNRPTPTTPTVKTSASYPSSASITSSCTATPVSSAPMPTTTGGRLPYLPRGPSADRGWDMDQTQYARSLSRTNSREGGHVSGVR